MHGIEVTRAKLGEKMRMVKEKRWRQEGQQAMLYIFGTAQRGANNSPIRSRDSRNLQKPSCSCETSFNAGGKTRNIVFQLVLWPCFCYSYYRILSKQCLISLNCCNLDLQLDVAAIKYPSEIITLCITVEYLSYNTRTSPATAWLAPKKGAIFRLIYFLQSFGIDHIPNHYSFRKQCHTAIPQTHSAFYPQRFFGGNQAVVFFNSAGSTTKRKDFLISSHGPLAFWHNHKDSSYRY